MDYAADRGVRLVVENCPMEGWHPDGYPANLAYSPQLWDWMAGLGLYLNFDPSHLTWLGIDPLAVLASYAERVLHVQAKDVEIDAAARNRVGVFGNAVDRASSPWDSGWWRYRIPGLGQIDWGDFVDDAGPGRLRRRRLRRARGPGLERQRREGRAGARARPRRT